MSDDSLSLVPLGTNGFIPTYGRQTMCFLVLGAERPLVLDAGSGLGRMLEGSIAELLAGYDELELVLTHYHLDHLVGLSYLPGVWSGRKLRLHLPAPPLVDGEPEDALNRLLGPPIFPRRFEEFPIDLQVLPYREKSGTVAGLPIRRRRQRHAGGSVGLVLDGTLAYLTDCEMESDLAAEFIAGASCLLHDTWVTEDEVAVGAPRHGHSTAEEVAVLARRAGVETLMPVHHRPDRRRSDLERIADRLREKVEGKVEVVIGEEGERYGVKS